MTGNREVNRILEGEEAGLSMLEVMLATTLLAVTFISIGLAVMTGVKSTMGMQERSVVENQAIRYMERLSRLNYGETSDPRPSPNDMDALFDDTVTAPEVSLQSIRTPVDNDGHRFKLAGFETEGTWEVRIDPDVDDSGTLSSDESKDDLLKIQICFRGRPVLTSCRARPAASN